MSDYLQCPTAIYCLLFLVGAALLHIVVLPNIFHFIFVTSYHILLRLRPDVVTCGTSFYNYQKISSEIDVWKEDM